jgi:hypothetical protein
MGIDNVISGLQNTVNYLSEKDVRLKSKIEQLGLSLSPVESGSIKNKKAIIWQVTNLPDKYKVPDLVMKINPQNLSCTYSQLINRKRTLGGFIEEHWGEQFDMISASGKTGQFFGVNGLTNANRRDTEAYRNFENLIAIYRNNGSLFHESSNKIIAQGSVVMNYDNCIYKGYFENFSISEIAEKQFELTYNFSFKVTQEVYPGRVKSFRNVTTVNRPGAPKNDRITLDIVNLQNGESNG